MKFAKKPQAIVDLVRAWDAASLRRNPEYQRGASWTLPQKQCLIDSVFRQYPIPPLFLQRITSKGLGGEVSVKYDVVDGQQRLLALHEFSQAKWPLLDRLDSRLKIPVSLRANPAPWSKRTYAELDESLRKKFGDSLIDVFMIEEVDQEDEVRGDCPKFCVTASEHRPGRASIIGGATHGNRQGHSRPPAEGLQVS